MTLKLAALTGLTLLALTVSNKESLCELVQLGVATVYARRHIKNVLKARCAVGPFDYR